MLNNITEKEMQQVSYLFKGVAKEIIDMLGYEKARDIFITLGGSTLSFSHSENIRDKSRYEMLCELISPELQGKMREYFGSVRVYIPNCSTAFSAIRRNRMINEYHTLRRQGYSASRIMIMICPKYGVSERELYKSMKKNQNEKRYN